MRIWAIALVVLAGFTCAQSQTLQDAQSALERKDYATALRTVRPLADRGDPAAQSLLWERCTRWGVGTAHLLGQGAPQNNAEALNWLRKAADQGHPNAQSNLGMMYALGRGVPATT